MTAKALVHWMGVALVAFAVKDALAWWQTILLIIGIGFMCKITGSEE